MPSPITLDALDLRWDQRQRLLFLECKALWSGQINTNDVRTVFGISRAQASKEFALYRQLAPHNLVYSTTAKTYLASEAFAPIFITGSARELLQFLEISVGEEVPVVAIAKSTTAAEVLTPPGRAVDMPTLQRVNQAIRERKRLAVLYQSMSTTEPKWLELSPHSLVHDGFRWHVRAYSEGHGEFRDFLLARMRSRPEIVGPSQVGGEQDAAWQRWAVIRIEPHPNLTAHQRQVVEHDYDMERGMLTLRLRAAIVPYYLHLLRLDSGDRERPAAEQQIVLANRQELSGLDSFG